MIIDATKVNREPCF